MDKFIKKPTVDGVFGNELAFTDEELIQIYNALGYTMTNVAMLNGFLQDENVLFVTEGNNHLINTIRYKIESELTRRSLDN